MAQGAERETKAGVSLTAFVAGNVGTLRIQPSSGTAWSGTSRGADSNAEATRRLLTAALLWLEGNDLMIEPALRGRVRLGVRNERS